MPHASAVLSVGLLGLLFFGQSLVFPLVRDDTFGLLDPTLRARLVPLLAAAHANTAEYAPLLALLCVLCGLGEPPAWARAAMALGVASRYAFVLGMVLSQATDAPHPLRTAASLGTCLAGLALTLAVLGGLSSGVRS